MLVGAHGELMQPEALVIGHGTRAPERADHAVTGPLTTSRSRPDPGGRAGPSAYATTTLPLPLVAAAIAA